MVAPIATRDTDGTIMRVASGFLLLALTMSASSGCIKKQFGIVGANQADATLVLQYEHGFEKYTVNWDRAEEDALERCEAWGYSQVEFSDVGEVECIEKRHRNVTGARPPGQSAEPGMGREDASRPGHRGQERRPDPTPGNGIRVRVLARHLQRPLLRLSLGHLVTLSTPRSASHWLNGAGSSAGRSPQS